MKRNKWIAILLTLIYLFGVIPTAVGAEETMELQGVKEVKYSSDAVQKFHLQDADFSLTDSSISNDAYASMSIGANVKEKRSSSNVEMKWSDSRYPLGYSYYRSGKSGSDDAAWYQWARWWMKGDEAALFQKLLNVAGNIQVGGRYQGHIDTQSGTLKGKAYFGIEQNKVDANGNATVISYKEHMMSGDEKKDTLHQFEVPFVNVDQQTNAIYLQMAGTKGTWLFWDDKNFAEVYYPQAFFRDVKAPVVQKVFVQGGTADQSAGTKNFANGDKLQIVIELSEPVRISDYNGAFKITAPGLSDFQTVEYNEVDYDKARLIYEATVVDSPDCRSFSDFVISVQAVKEKVKDLAGNYMADSPFTGKDSSVRLDGYLPRIDAIDLISVRTKKDDGTYVTNKENKRIIKPGDSLNIKVHFNQDVKENTNNLFSFPVSVDGKTSWAPMKVVYNDGVQVSTADKYASNRVLFDAAEYQFTVPESASHGAEITVPAKQTNGYWELTEMGKSLSGMVGNQKLDTNRRSLQSRTEIKAQSGENGIFSLTADTEAPGVTLTDDKGKPAENVFEKPEEAAAVKTAKSNYFRIYVKSDEIVSGSVKAELKYVSKEAPVSPVTLAAKTTGAYTGNNILSDMFLEFTVPDTVEIDSATHDIYIETTVMDEVYNKRVQKFYLAADTKPPKTKVINGNGKGEPVTSGDIRYWEYKLEIDEAATPDGTRLYYKIGNEDYQYTDASSGFTVKTPDLSVSEEGSGTVYFYAEDGSGNKEAETSLNYYISDKRKVTPVNEQEVGAYLPSRNIEFTGFKAPEKHATGDVYDHLVYSINGGTFKAIRSEDGGDVEIPKEELSDSAVISYKLLRNTEADFNIEEEAELLRIVYHCDDTAPGVLSEVFKDSSGNAVSVKVASPENATGHPKNIVSAKMVLSDGTNELELDTSECIQNGVFYTNVDLTEIISDKTNAFTSGRYTLTATVTDANGHTSEMQILGEKGMDVIVDAPAIKNIHVKSAHDPVFDDGIASFAMGDTTAEDVVITADSVEAMMRSGKRYTKKADLYRAEVQLYMQYSGTQYPRAEEEDVWYALSEDSGETWTEYTKAQIRESEAQIIEEDGVQYAVYTAAVDIPGSKEDGFHVYNLRFRVGGNAYVSDILTVETKTDTTAPRIRFMVDAIGSDETGWSTDIGYTKEHVRYAFTGTDNGFMGPVAHYEILKIVDKDGNVVPESDYNDYVEVQYTYNVVKHLIFKQRCRIFVRGSDQWENSVDSDYECMYIDDLPAEHRIYNQDTDEYTYMTVANVAKVSIGATAPGNLTMTKEAQETLRNLVQSGIVEESCYGEQPAQIDGKIIAMYRFRQTKPADSDYDIIATTYETDGSEIETFQILSVVSEAEPITKLSESNTARGLGKAIRAVETMTFNVPVAQVTGEGAALLEEHGLEMAGDLYTGDMMFSTELNAILDIHTGGTVYVVDRLGRAEKITVDVTGTEFVEFTGHTVSYEEINQVGSIRRDESFIYSDNAAVRITVSGGEAVAAVKAELRTPFVTSASSATDTSGSEFEGYYQNLILEAPTGFADREGTMVAAQLKVKNKTNLEEYHDVIVLRCDDKAPTLLDAVQMKRSDRYAPINVIYLFHDRYGVVSVERSIGETFIETASAGGVALVRYLENGRAIVRATDGNGNVLLTGGPDISGIVISNNLAEGRDYSIEVLDQDKNPAEPGAFYQAVYVKVVPIQDGKAFTSTAIDGIYTDKEEDLILELVDEYGQKILHRFTPPVDRTAPKIFALQNNSGDYVTEIVYTVSVSDLRSGVARVYAEGAGENGEDVELEFLEKDGVYQHYTYQATSTKDVTVVAVDGAGNRSETKLTSNSQIVGPLAIEVQQSIIGATNKNVVMTLRAEDGRRIYTHVPEEQGDSYLKPGEYIVSGNDIVFTKNGSVGVLCRDEAGNEVSRILTVTNIDKTKPEVTPVIGELKNENDEVRTDAVSVRFVPKAEDDRYMEIYLLHVERKPSENDAIDIARLKERWNEYQKDPENFVLTGEFSELYDALYKLDIKDDNTYAIVTENGTHTFYLMDRAGNLVTVPVTVTTIDETAPAITDVTYSFSTAPKLQTVQTVKNAVTEDKIKESIIEISKDTTGYLTSGNVDITITADEPIRFYGSNDKEYKTSITKAFLKNGVYHFAIEDKAGNVTEKNIGINNILNRELYMDFDEGEIVIFKGKESTFDKSVLEKYSVYTCDENGEKKTLSKEEFAGEIDYGTLNIEDLTQNSFDRSNPYTITYRAADEAGNRVERTRRVVLADVTDIFVTVNGEIPNGASCVYVDKGTVTVDVANYGLQAVVKATPGQKNGAQMKFAEGELAQNASGQYTFEANEPGWYTIGVRTLFQDIFVIWVYVG